MTSFAVGIYLSYFLTAIIWLLPFLLRNKYPNKIWLAVLLGFLNPFGQFYIKKNGVWFALGLIVVGMIIKIILFPSFNLVSITALPSAMINYFRIVNHIADLNKPNDEDNSNEDNKINEKKPINE